LVSSLWFVKLDCHRVKPGEVKRGNDAVDGAMFRNYFGAGRFRILGVVRGPDPRNHPFSQNQRPTTDSSVARFGTPDPQAFRQWRDCNRVRHIHIVGRDDKERPKLFRIASIKLS
jgi:hypothetical protein